MSHHNAAGICSLGTSLVTLMLVVHLWGCRHTEPIGVQIDDIDFEDADFDDTGFDTADPVWADATSGSAMTGECADRCSTGMTEACDLPASSVVSVERCHIDNDDIPCDNDVSWYRYEDTAPGTDTVYADCVDGWEVIVRWYAVEG